MPLVSIGAGEFEDRVIGSTMAVVTFMTAGSEAYAALAPDLEALADANADIVFATIDAEEQVQLAAAARIDAIPTIMAFREGSLVFRERGALEVQTLQQLIDALRALDMEQVRAALVEQARRHQHHDHPHAVEVTVAELAEALPRHALVVDVRTPLEYASGHVPGAVLMPLHELGRRAENLPQDARIYVICKTGDRSQQACGLLAGLGFEAVNVAGGMVAWGEAGLELEFDQTP